MVKVELSTIEWQVNCHGSHGKVGWISCFNHAIKLLVSLEWLFQAMTAIIIFFTLLYVFGEVHCWIVSCRHGFSLTIVLLTHHCSHIQSNSFGYFHIHLLVPNFHLLLILVHIFQLECVQCGNLSITCCGHGDWLTAGCCFVSEASNCQKNLLCTYEVILFSGRRLGQSTYSM